MLAPDNNSVVLSGGENYFLLTHRKMNRWSNKAALWIPFFVPLFSLKIKASTRVFVKLTL
jgi:hypothetical protein